MSAMNDKMRRVNMEHKTHRRCAYADRDPSEQDMIAAERDRRITVQARAIAERLRYSANDRKKVSFPRLLALYRKKQKKAANGAGAPKATSHKVI